MLVCDVAPVVWDRTGHMHVVASGEHSKGHTTINIVLLPASISCVVCMVFVTFRQMAMYVLSDRKRLGKSGTPLTRHLNCAPFGTQSTKHNPLKTEKQCKMMK